MQPDAIQRKIIEAARRNPPSDKVPYAFEARIMAHIAEASKAHDTVLAMWSRVLWKACAPCVALALVMSIWTAMSKELPAVQDDASSVDIESTVMAQFDNGSEAW